MSQDGQGGLFDLTSFDSPFVKAVMPPVVAAAGVLVALCPLGFLLTGFHVWVHEFGHASVAWLTGKRALPLPIGWTNIEAERSPLVYVGIPVLLFILALAGWRERKVWPVVLAVAVLALQTWMTWLVPEARSREWEIFGGVGGEFYLAAAMIGLFFFEFPDGFRWGACRYLFLFIGAGSFYQSYLLWFSIKHGLEDIPYGSMINGEDDGGGDMNILRDDYGWTQHQIFNTYFHLGNACLIGLLAIYLYFNLRLDRIFDRYLARVIAR
ncbi:MAG TPA: hypothetical protein VFE25_11295 [Opitutaceae bacterium]|jgi:hypothetical protein|nr:hypothetical protein [Opitutaceae bacterium]